MRWACVGLGACAVLLATAAYFLGRTSGDERRPTASRPAHAGATPTAEPGSTTGDAGLSPVSWDSPLTSSTSSDPGRTFSRPTGNGGSAKPSASADLPAGAARPATPRTIDPTESLAMVLFRRLDADVSGRLTGDEIPDTLRDSADSAAIERGVTPAEFRAYFRARVRQAKPEDLSAIIPAPNPPAAGSSVAIPPPKPGELPAWFAQLDPAGTGQVGLAAWRTAGGTIEDFRRLDRDGDGQLTRRELAAALAQPGEATIAATVGPAAAPAAVLRGGSAKATANALDKHYVAVAARTAAAAKKPATVKAVATTVPLSVQKTPTTTATAPAATAPAPTSSSSDSQATLPLPIAGNSYWEGRNAQNLSVLAGRAKPNVLFLGDSITDWLATGVGQPVWDAEFAPLGASDFAVAGITTSEVLWQVETGQVAAASPKVVVLMIGTNNIGLGQSAEAAAAGVTRIVDEIRVQLPDTRILLLGLLPRGTSLDDPLRLGVGEVNRRIAKLDDGDFVTYLDIGSSFLNADGTVNPAALPDYLHPSLWGYQLYTADILPTLTKLLSEE